MASDYVVRSDVICVKHVDKPKLLSKNCSMLSFGRQYNFLMEISPGKRKIHSRIECHFQGFSFKTILRCDRNAFPIKKMDYCFISYTLSMFSTTLCIHYTVIVRRYIPWCKQHSVSVKLTEKTLKSMCSMLCSGIVWGRLQLFLIVCGFRLTKKQCSFNNILQTIASENHYPNPMLMIIL